ncbi:MAG TPA: hypothetical protein VIL35_13480 [Vicinamibacterales bacterium]
MISVRVTRDRRGYDHIYLVSEQRKKGRTEGRLLYWARIPGGMRVGREPLDEETRAEIERANPDLTFDWPALLKALHQSAAAARWAARQQRLMGGSSAASRSGRRPAPGAGADEDENGDDDEEPWEPHAAG